jgi:hypothetical protein
LYALLVKALKGQISELEGTEKYSQLDDNILVSLKEELGEAEKNLRKLIS